MEIILLILHDMLFAAVPALGFAMVFNIPKQLLPYCALGGAIGHATRTSFLHAGMSIEWASFAAAIVIGCLGIYWAKRQIAHPKVFTVAGIIPLIPGVYAFKAVIALVELNSFGYDDVLFSNLMNNGLKSVFILGALVIGLTMPGLLFYRRRSVL